MKLLDGVTADASFSPCKTWRYILTRRWDSRPTVLFVMLNPSHATAHEDDRTVRKCQQYARQWGYGGIDVCNIFALRSTDPKALYRHPDPVGPANDTIIETYATSGRTALVVAAWGAHGAHRNRGLIVTRMLTTAGVELHRLGPPTKGGHPGHPLYLPPDIELEVHRTAMPLVREEVAAASRALPPPALDRMHTPSVGPRGDGYTDPASTGGAA